MTAKPAKKLTVADLEAALAPTGSFSRFSVFEHYCKQKPTPDAIPALRKALADGHHAVVKCAAVALRKLGPLAAEAMEDLLAAAAHVDARGMPQAYPECVEAMAAIQPTHPRLLPLIKQFTGLDNWVPISASLRALKTIGTPEALDLLRRTAAFRLPELNKMQRRVVEQLLADVAGPSLDAT